MRRPQNLKKKHPTLFWYYLFAASQNAWNLETCHAHFFYLARASCKFPRARDLSSRFVVPFVSTPSLMVLNCKLKIKFSTSICKPFCSSSTYWLDMVYRKRGFHRNIKNIRLHFFLINSFLRSLLTKKIDFESQIDFGTLYGFVNMQ